MSLFKARKPDAPLILDADVQADLDEYAWHLGHLARLIYRRVESSPALTQHLTRVMARMLPAIITQRGDKIMQVLDEDPFARTMRESLNKGWSHAG